jgi:hypothetical protein
MSDEENHEIWCHFCHEDQRMGGQYCCDAYKKECLDIEKAKSDAFEEGKAFLKRNGFVPKWGFSHYHPNEINMFEIIDWLKTKGMK